MKKGAAMPPFTIAESFLLCDKESSAKGKEPNR